MTPHKDRGNIIHEDSDGIIDQLLTLLGIKLLGDFIKQRIIFWFIIFDNIFLIKLSIFCIL